MKAHTNGMWGYISMLERDCQLIIVRIPCDGVGCRDGMQSGWNEQKMTLGMDGNYEVIGMGI